MRNKTTLAAVLAASLLGIGAAAHAQIAVTIAPPAPVVEAVPIARPGYIWAPGHYEWHHGQYSWIRGHWMAERSGYEYREPRWVQRANGEWFMVGNNWEHRRWERERERDHEWRERQRERRHEWRERQREHEDDHDHDHG